MDLFADLFAPNGAHVLVDGQFGSTGKGLFASYLANKALAQGQRFDAVISNAGPNSGHTFYHEGEKHVLKQLPTFAVKTALLDLDNEYGPVAVLSAGAIIDPKILWAEAKKYPNVRILVHPNAAVISDLAKADEQGGSIAAVAGTRSGTGAAIARKVFREPNAVWGEKGGELFNMPANVVTGEYICHPHNRVFLEVSQGFSLGLNSRFYPKVTSRECTVMQAIADARIAPKFVTKTYMVIRTYPIRVGDFEGFSSGGYYPDQEEISWGAIGQTPELTTVTQRVRRVFTFSNEQYIEALRANQPDIVLVNFMNYLKNYEVEQFHRRLVNCHHQAEVQPATLFGWGPHDGDVA